jgi:heme exporter protein C
MNMQIPKKLKILDWFSFFLILFTCWLIFYKTPVEMNMGLVQKIFYFHVAYAWIGMVSFLVAAISAIIFLRKGLVIYDAVTESAVEIGLVFTLIAIITGSIWARPIWNTWWTWDPRLTTTSIMALIYAGYLFLRGSLDNPEKRRKITSIYSIIGCLSVPLTFFSIRGVRSIHPVVFGGDTPDFNMDSQMLRTMLIAIAVFSIFYIAVMWHRIRLAELKEEIEQLKLTSEEDHD